MQHASDDLDAVQFVTVHGGGKAQGRPGIRAVDDEDRRRHRNALEEFGGGPGEALCGSRRNRFAEECERCRRTGSV